MPQVGVQLFDCCPQRLLLRRLNKRLGLPGALCLLLRGHIANGLCREGVGGRRAETSCIARQTSSASWSASMDDRLL